MDNIKQLADEIFRDRVRHARAMSPEEKLCSGIDLFEQACHRMRDGIRMQFPGTDDVEVERILRLRLKRLRRVAEHKLYRPVEESEL